MNIIYLLYIIEVSLIKRCPTYNSSSSDCEKPSQNKHRRLFFSRQKWSCDSSSDDCFHKRKCPKKCEFISYDQSGLRGSIRGDIDRYLQLIQGIILQGSISVERSVKYYCDEMKNHLLNGTQSLNKATAAQALSDFSKLEEKLISTVARYNKDILKETENLITTTNNDILDFVVTATNKANKAIVTSITALTIPPIKPDSTVPLAETLKIVNNGFVDLLNEIQNIFKKATVVEKATLSKIITDNRNAALKDISLELEGFKQKMTGYFNELLTNESKMITTTVDHASRKLLCEMEFVITQIGQGIFSVLKGCNVNFRPLLNLNTDAVSSVGSFARCNRI